MDIIISQFNTTNKAKVLRNHYYRKASLNTISSDDIFGTTFYNTNFKSISYNWNYLINILKNNNYIVKEYYKDSNMNIGLFTKGN